MIQTIQARIEFIHNFHKEMIMISFSPTTTTLARFNCACPDTKKTIETVSESDDEESVSSYEEVSEYEDEVVSVEKERQVNESFLEELSSQSESSHRSKRKRKRGSSVSSSNTDLKENRPPKTSERLGGGLESIIKEANSRKHRKLSMVSPINPKNLQFDSPSLTARPDNDISPDPPSLLARRKRPRLRRESSGLTPSHSSQSDGENDSGRMPVQPQSSIPAVTATAFDVTSGLVALTAKLRDVYPSPAAGLLAHESDDGRNEVISALGSSNKEAASPERDVVAPLPTTNSRRKDTRALVSSLEGHMNRFKQAHPSPAVPNETSDHDDVLPEQEEPVLDRPRMREIPSRSARINRVMGKRRKPVAVESDNDSKLPEIETQREPEVAPIENDVSSSPSQTPPPPPPHARSRLDIDHVSNDVSVQHGDDGDADDDSDVVMENGDNNDEDDDNKQRDEQIAADDDVVQMDVDSDGGGGGDDQDGAEDVSFGQKEDGKSKPPRLDTSERISHQKGKRKRTATVMELGDTDDDGEEVQPKKKAKIHEKEKSKEQNREHEQEKGNGKGPSKRRRKTRSQSSQSSLAPLAPTPQRQRRRSSGGRGNIMSPPKSDRSHPKSNRGRTSLASVGSATSSVRSTASRRRLKSRKASYNTVFDGADLNDDVDMNDLPDIPGDDGGAEDTNENSPMDVDDGDDDGSLANPAPKRRRSERLRSNRPAKDGDEADDEGGNEAATAPNGGKRKGTKSKSKAKSKSKPKSKSKKGAKKGKTSSKRRKPELSDDEEDETPPRKKQRIDVDLSQKRRNDEQVKSKVVNPVGNGNGRYPRRVRFTNLAWWAGERVEYQRDKIETEEDVQKLVKGSWTREALSESWKRQQKPKRKKTTQKKGGKKKKMRKRSPTPPGTPDYLTEDETEKKFDETAYVYDSKKSEVVRMQVGKRYRDLGYSQLPVPEESKGKIRPEMRLKGVKALEGAGWSMGFLKIPPGGTKKPEFAGFPELFHVLAAEDECLLLKTLAREDAPEVKGFSRGDCFHIYPDNEYALENLSEKHMVKLLFVLISDPNAAAGEFEGDDGECSLMDVGE